MANTLATTGIVEKGLWLNKQWHAFARVAWFLLAVPCVTATIAGIPAVYRVFHTLCSDGACQDTQQLTPDSLRLLEAHGLSAGAYAAYFVALNIAFTLAFVGIAALLFWRQSSEPMALFVALMLLLLGTIQTPMPDYLTTGHPLLHFPLAVLAIASNIVFGLFFYLFPDGRFVPSWTRPVATLFIMRYLLQAAFVIGVGSGDLPFSSVWRITDIVFFLTMLAAQVTRYRRVSEGLAQQQTKWVVYGIAVFLAVLTGYFALDLTLSPAAKANPFVTEGLDTILYVAAILLPVSLGGAILRYRLYDIDLLINRTLVYATLTVTVVALYVFIVGGLATLFRASGNAAFSLLATGITAVIFQPLRTRVQYLVNRLTFGERDDPYSVLSRLGARLAQPLTPDDVLPIVVQTVTESLRLPYAAITLAWGGADMLVAEAGILTPTPVRLPLVYRGEPVGELRIAPRTPDESLTLSDHRLLDGLARHAAVAAHAVRLTTDLRQARERLVTAREEERRRLRRELHDGLGAQLAALNLQAGTLRVLVRSDPDAADAEIVALRGELRAAIADIRRLVHGLRPPALDEIGLVAALQQRANAFGAVVAVTVEAPADLPPLPAAVEVAVYRIVEEALTNVVRHAAAQRCVVRLSLGNGLDLTVTDDGSGLPTARTVGVGTVSMRERAVELGEHVRLPLRRVVVRAWPFISHCF